MILARSPNAEKTGHAGSGGDFWVDIRTIRLVAQSPACGKRPYKQVIREKSGRETMSMTVLVVEDDLELNELLGEYLTIEGIRYLQATSGQEGVHLAGTQRPDVIILDLMLPDIDGFEVARTLSTHRATYDIPIIILSCMCQDCDKNKGYASGALFFMNKPFLPDEVIATVKQALAWKAQQGNRTPAGVITMGGEAAETAPCSKSTNQMVADLFSKTELADAAVTDIREAIETLSAWAREWNAGHPNHSHMKVDYRVQPREAGETETWWRGRPWNGN